MKGIAGYLNDLDPHQAGEALARCCASQRLVRGLLAARPFASDRAFLERLAALEAMLGAQDWLEAFAAHPRIGSQTMTSAWSHTEQAAAVEATQSVRQALAAGNQAYEARFGHVFLICATGLDAATLLRALERRLHNEPSAELAIAAAEQAKITRLRLAKLMAHPGPELLAEPNRGGLR